MLPCSVFDLFFFNYDEYGANLYVFNPYYLNITVFWFLFLLPSNNTLYNRIIFLCTVFELIWMNA